MVFFSQLIVWFDKRIEDINAFAQTLIDLNLYFKNQELPFGKTDNRQGKDRVLDVERLNEQIAIYIVAKVLKICNKYENFRQYAEACYSPEKEFLCYVIKDAKELTRALLNDQTHITLKLKQAINAFIGQQLENAKWESSQDPDHPTYLLYQTTIKIKEIREITQKAYSGARYAKKNLSHFIPVALFHPNVQIKDGGVIFPFSQLSSGEQQLIHSVHSVLYHLLNLESLARPLDKHPVNLRSANKFRSVNLILDEIELYYHPSYQRDFIKTLLESIEKIDLEYINGLNIIFSTHSPFILSDIPSSNVLKLQGGEPANFKQDQETFGANIHDMLADSFFLDESLIGGFAEKTINKCIDSLNAMRIARTIEKINSKEKKNDDDQYQLVKLREELAEIKSRTSFETYQEAHDTEEKSRYLAGIINLIGEPVIRFKLLEMYDEVMLDEHSEKREQNV